MTNVVLICTDQWRGDCLSCQQHPDVYTPFLDDIADKGVVCDRAYSPCPTCVPARVSLFTGLDPAHHGRVGYKDGIPFDFDTTLAGEFSRAGYHTQAVGKMHVYPERHRAGFDNVILHDGYLHHSHKGRRDVRFYDDYEAWLRQQPGRNAWDDEYIHGLHCNAVAAHPWTEPEAYHPTNWATTQAIEWLYRRDPTQPFFLYLSYHRPHAPYNPPQWAWDMYDNPALYDAIGNWEESYVGEFRDNTSPMSWVARYRDDVWRAALRGYYGCITHIDTQIERFIEALDDFGLREDTVLCFTSDHGDMLGEHGLWRKGYPYEGSAHIPMIFQGPGVASGEHNDQLMNLTDIMPTLLDLAGIPIPETLDGISQAGALRPASEKEAPDLREIHGEHILFGQSLQWIIMGHYKYVWWSKTGREQLFNLAEDPHELNDLAYDVRPESLPELLRARAALIARLEGRPEGFVSEGALIPGRPVTEYIR